MFPSFCGAMGVAGWLIMLLVWAALIAALVWGITRLLPDRADTAVPTPPHQRPGGDVEPPLVESHRR